MTSRTLGIGKSAAATEAGQTYNIQVEKCMIEMHGNILYLYHLVETAFPSGFTIISPLDKISGLPHVLHNIYSYCEICSGASTQNAAARSAKAKVIFSHAYSYHYNISS